MTIDATFKLQIVSYDFPKETLTFVLGCFIPFSFSMPYMVANIVKERQELTVVMKGLFLSIFSKIIQFGIFLHWIEFKNEFVTSVLLFLI